MPKNPGLDRIERTQGSQVNYSRKVVGYQLPDSSLSGAISTPSPSVPLQQVNKSRVWDSAAAGRLIAIMLVLCTLPGCGGSSGTVPSASVAQVAIAVSPSSANLEPGGSQEFVATVTGASD